MRTARLDLEPVSIAHADEAWPYVDDERLWSFFPMLRPRSLEQLREIYARRERGYAGADGEQIWGNWILRTRVERQLVGDVQATIFPKQRSALVAYATYPGYQRRGYAREAVAALIEHLFEAHDLERILAEMDVRNVASYRLVESLGFARVEMREGEYVYELLHDGRNVGAE
ncbi:MAG: GNAT family N-acetyltransferase [Vulcanimicrobiaceae bacterium]